MPKGACLEITNPNGEVASHELERGRGVTAVGRHVENNASAASPSSPLLAACLPDQHDGCIPYYGFSVGEPIPKRQTLSWFTRSGQVVVPVTNQSSCETRFRLEGADEAGICRFEFQVPGEAVSLARQIELPVQPSETAFVSVHITPLSRQLVSLGKQTHFCTLAITMLGEQPRRRAVLTQLQSAPLIGPGLTALITLCLVVLVGFLLPFDGLGTPQQIADLAATDVKVAQGDEAEKASSANLGIHSGEATPILTENIASQASVGGMTYEEMFKEIAQEYDLDWRILAQQAYRESHLDPLDIGDVNEVGLMQILPSTWNEWAPKVGVTDPFDPYSNTLVAAAYLSYLKGYFSSMGYPGDHWMLVAYNWGPHNLRQLLENGGGWAQVPVETRQYVLDIMQATERGM